MSKKNLLKAKSKSSKEPRLYFGNVKLKTKLAKIFKAYKKEANKEAKLKLKEATKQYDNLDDTSDYIKPKLSHFKLKDADITKILLVNSLSKYDDTLKLDNCLLPVD